MANIRLIPSIDKDPRLVRFAQRPVGRLSVAATVLIGMYISVNVTGQTGPYPVTWYIIPLVVLVVSFCPQARWPIITLASVTWLIIGAPIHWSAGYSAFVQLGQNFDQRTARWIMVATMIALGGAVALTQLWRIRRPFRAFVLIYLMFLALWSNLWQLGYHNPWGWLILTVIANTTWYLGYALQDINPIKSPSRVQLGYIYPFWNTFYVPIPKGPAYLRKIEAKDPQSFAICQLKGLKLLAWGALLNLAFHVLTSVAHGGQLWGLGHVEGLGIKSFTIAFDDTLMRRDYTWYGNWTSVVTSFLFDLLRISVWGHYVIATLRLLGYYALRNTYRPLESRSLLDFWNRYFYYFKELLVDFFFYPTFFRYFKRHPRLRLMAATFCAACLGNFLFHFMADTNAILTHGFWGALIHKHVFAIYTFVLALSIGLSQLRLKKVRDAPRHWLILRLTTLWVIGFNCILCTLSDIRTRDTNIVEHMHFLLSLINVNWQ